MANPRGIWHLIERLDGYGGARALRYLTARQPAEGNRVAVVALDADPRIASELAAAGVEVQVLGARWDWDPLALGKLWELNRKRYSEWKHRFVWDARSQAYARLATLGDRAPRRVTATAVVDVNAFPAQVPGDLRGELELDVAAPLIAAVGPLERRKQLDEAIWCFELVRVLHPAARLVIIGDGPDRLRLERLALAISEPGCIRFLGYQHDVPELLRQVDLLWQLEPAAATPCAVLEAMVAGTPIVASDVPAHREAIESGVSGLLAPAGSRVEIARATDDLFNDRALAAQLAAAAKERVVGMHSLEKLLARFGAGDR